MTSLARPTALIGTAGWSIPAQERARFPEAGSILERYAQVFAAVEINSSFYRPHLPATYRRWAESTPPAFRFSLKMPKQISHVAKLQNCDAELDKFLFETSHMGDKLGCLLLQLPPSLAFNENMERFFEALRQRFGGPVAFEPRHASWLEPPARTLLKSKKLWMVHADPSPIDLDIANIDAPHYLRLHGSPRIYYSAYGADHLTRYAALLDQGDGSRWCIFDNTAAGAAIADALALKALCQRD